MKYKQTSAFTLIELVVSITILSIVMMSIFYIFVLSADINNKTDIARSMQENVKNIVEFISEDVRKNEIVGVNSPGALLCTIDSGNPFTSGDKLCIQTATGMHEYYLGKSSAIGNITRVYNHSECTTLDPCFLVFQDEDGPIKLSNDWVDFRSLRFEVT